MLPSTITPPPSVLMVTCAEYGQANVILATAFELALTGANVCIASFAPLRARVTRLQELIARNTRPEDGKVTGSVSFHECSFTPYWDAIGKYGMNDVTLPHPPGTLGASASYRSVIIAAFPWNLEENVAIIKSIKDMIATMKPDMVVVDSLIPSARDACRVVGQPFMVLSPNSILDVILSLQPSLSMSWTYPAISSGFPFPLKWWQVPLNMYLNFRVLIELMASKNFKQAKSMRRSLGIEQEHGQNVSRKTSYICPALPETDFPFPSIPEQLILVGPVVMPFDPLEKSDPTLKRWLDNGPTVMINLGSHAVSDQKLVREMAGALRILVDHHDRQSIDRIQVLWKAKAGGDVGEVIDAIIGHEIKEGRVKVVAWLDAEPVSILQHPNVICTVHHGGANSFFEGVWSGVPQVILPVWFDTYDYANRAEFLNIGIFGNKKCAPGARAHEFGQALVRVTGNTEEAMKFRSAAKRLQDVCRTKGNGRELSCAAILKEIHLTC